MMKEVDFTYYPVGMGPRGRKIAVCPVCGRNGEFTIYTSKESLYVHTARAENGWLVVRDKCMLPAMLVSDEGEVALACYGYSG